MARFATAPDGSNNTARSTLLLLGKDPGVASSAETVELAGRVEQYTENRALHRWFRENDHARFHNGPSTGLVAALLADELLKAQAAAAAAALKWHSIEDSLARTLREYRIILLGFSFHSEEVNPVHNWPLERAVAADIPNLFLC